MQEAVGDDLKVRLEAMLATGTTGERTIAAYLSENMGQLPFETAATIAQALRVSEVSVGRFARALGYRNLKEMKEALKSDVGLAAFAGVGDSPWLQGPALRAHFNEGGGVGGVALERELRAVMRNHQLAATPEFAEVAARLATKRQVYVAGFQTERGLATYLAHNLAYLRPGVFALGLDSGHFSELFLDDPQDTALIVIETRRYSRLAVEIVRKAKAQGIPVTVITDPYCGWAPELANEVLRVDTDFDHFWDATG
ncbi:MAG: MurR/RpiR family transcriptional regulator, partial [Gemmobacter sp.]|nr:MurR/RpiR family transcriptional regulator [Gemmobacter sp.]